jgi:vacuolar-type H+-ATPase subunit F/Vma7
MRVSVIGTEEDVIGFALAGWPGRVCDDEASVAAALQSDCRDPDVALLLVSQAAADLASAAVQRLQATPGAPIVIVLPAGEDATCSNQSVARQQRQAVMPSVARVPPSTRHDGAAHSAAARERRGPPPLVAEFDRQAAARSRRSASEFERAKAEARGPLKRPSRGVGRSPT